MVQRDWRRLGIRLHDPHLLFSGPGGADVGEFSGADQEKVSVGQILNSQKTLMLEMASEQPAQLGFEIDFKGIPKTFAHESDALAIGRPGGALSESG